MMRIRKILGGVTKGHISHSVAKLDNGFYTVGRLTLGQFIEMDKQFKTLDTAFEHWLTTLPITFRFTQDIHASHKTQRQAAKQNLVHNTVHSRHLPRFVAKKF